MFLPVPDDRVQPLPDHAVRRVPSTPPLAAHPMAAPGSGPAGACEHGILDALTHAGVHAVADTGYQCAGPTVAVPQRRRRLDPDTGRYRRLSEAQKEVNTAHARQSGPGERVNAQLKSWKILRKIRTSPSNGTVLVKAVQTLILAA